MARVLPAALAALMLATCPAGAFPPLKPAAPADWLVELADAPPESRPWEKLVKIYSLPRERAGQESMRLYNLMCERARKAGYVPPKCPTFEYAQEDPRFVPALTGGQTSAMLITFKWYEANKGKPPTHLCTEEFNKTGKVK